ncbi:MAG: hypothetical protein KC933_00510 [Myxococcales bacterium]|nr:hypothetical protein [Myxococcales bacterium]MCB9648973.1 hypothetical protein [Deltaproteobacteria bacterium]
MPITLEAGAGCLDVASEINGLLTPTTCTGGPSQQWRVHPTGEIQSVSTGVCLAPTLALFRNSPRYATTMACINADARAWTLSPAGELRIGSSCLTTSGTGSTIVLSACNGSIAQHYTPRLAADTSLEATFGFGQKRRSAGHATQHVPLVRVYVNYTLGPSGGLAHGVAYYEDLIFGTGFPRLNGFLDAASSGLFQWIDGGHFGPFDRPTTDSGCDTGPVLQDIISTSLAGRLDLARFDLDRDGTVRHDELQFMVIGNCGGRIAGAARTVGCIDGLDSGTRNLRACPGYVAEIEDEVQFATLAHESLHTLGAGDMYGLGSERASTMAATIWIDAGPDATHTLMLDAWHRFQLGWNRPRVVSLDLAQPTSGTLSLDGDPNYQSSLILGTPNTYFFLERRSQIGYDADGRGDGVAMWRIGPGVDEVALYNPATNTIGNGPYLQGSDSAVLQFPDGHGVTVVTQGSLSGSLNVSWSWPTTMSLSIVENSHTSVSTNITVTGTNHFSGAPLTAGTVWLDGNQISVLGRPFDYPVRLIYTCFRGLCTVRPRLQTFTVKAPGYEDATFSRF